MPVPPKHLSRSKGRRRRSQDALTKPLVSLCPACKAPRIPHRACSACGVYGKHTVPVKTKKKKTTKK